MYFNGLTTIDSLGKTDAIGWQVANVLVQTYDGRFLLNKQENWVAVPCEGFLSDQISIRLSHVAKEQSHLLAYSLLRQCNIPNAFQVPITFAGINELSKIFNMVNFIIFPPDLTWLVLFVTSENYFIVVGLPSTVEAILDMSTEAAYAKFNDFVPLSSFLDTISVRESVLHQLKYEYSQATGGSFIRFPEYASGNVLWPPSYNRF